MHLTTVFSSLVVLGGLAVAAPVVDVPPEEPCVEQIICIDALSACGVKYGGCYNVCKVSEKPKPPPCPATSTVVTTKVVQLTPSATKKTTSTSSKRTLTTSTRKVTTTTTKKATTTTKKTSTTAKATATSKRPTSTKKPTTTPKPPVTTYIPTPTKSSTCNGSGLTVCADYINDCGMMYGGCFPDCKPWPTFTAPPCRVTTRIVPVPTQSSFPYPILTVGPRDE
ncbi:hypothetical protein B0T21DRAFT_204917 [Apiosordaria backusii]|uniref:Uncharacterized protein n=1 Tax=Apiosordaria backusii TaxID=314023 RepID=A0AA40B7S3_9PEZI|nr:hypothetical protein B0T21DRAFT_204917 [Apiosordaria backusii]